MIRGCQGALAATRLQQLDDVGGKGMPHTSRGLGTDKEGETAEVGPGNQRKVMMKRSLCPYCPSTRLVRFTAVSVARGKGGVDDIDDMLGPGAET